MIQHYPYTALPAYLKQALDKHISEEFGHIPFVQERTWAEPDWTFIKFEGEEVAAFYNVVIREVTFDGALYKTAGINNVITPKAYKGRGYSSQILRETEAYLFKELRCDYGLLLCADALVTFYSRLNWYSVVAELYYDQPSGTQLYDSNIMLLSALGCHKLHPQHIYLNGLPW